MTTIVATASKNYAVILSESQISDEDSYLRMPSDNVKVVKNGNWIIAGAGWSRPSDVIQYVMKWPTIPKAVVAEGQQEMTIWIIKNVIPKISLVLEKNKSIDFDKGTAGINDAEFLLATYGHLFVLDSGFGVTPIQDYFVTGSGGKIALGAIAIQKELNLNEWAINHKTFNKQSIDIAIKYDLYSSGTIRGYSSTSNGEIKSVTYR